MMFIRFLFRYDLGNNKISLKMFHPLIATKRYTRCYSSHYVKRKFKGVVFLVKCEIILNFSILSTNFDSAL